MAKYSKYALTKEFPVSIWCRFPGVQRPVTEYGPKGGQEVPPAESGEVEEDDFDLFGDDDDEEEVHKKRLREGRGDWLSVW